MKKKILSILLTLCMVLTLMPAMPVRVSADDHTDHCICGASHTIVGDHNAEKSLLMRKKVGQRGIQIIPCPPLRVTTI